MPPRDTVSNRAAVAVPVADDEPLTVVEAALVRAVSAAIVKRLIQEETEDRQDRDGVPDAPPG